MSFIAIFLCRTVIFTRIQFVIFMRAINASTGCRIGVVEKSVNIASRWRGGGWRGKRPNAMKNGAADPKTVQNGFRREKSVRSRERMPLAKRAKFAKRLRALRALLGALGVLGEKMIRKMVKNAFSEACYAGKWPIIENIVPKSIFFHKSVGTEPDPPKNRRNVIFSSSATSQRLARGVWPRSLDKLGMTALRKPVQAGLRQATI